jgi:hypothetical protein
VLPKSPTNWPRTIPGFRSGMAWKSIVAVAGYLFLAFFLAAEVSTGNISGILLVLGILVIVLVAANAWGTRIRIPLVKSPNKLLAAAGWTIFLVVWLAVIGLAAPPSTTGPLHNATALAPSATATPSRTVAETVSPSPTRSTTASPTATPTASPTKATVVVVATTKSTAPPPPPPPPPAPFNYCGAPANPWHYTFCAGNLINSPPSNFCSYFACIPSFWKSTLGYVDQCVDGMYSHSGGRQGACSNHGGESRPLYGP